MENLQGFETWFFGSLISILLVIIGFFLKRNVDKLESMVQKHDDVLNDHETRIQMNEYKGGEGIRLSQEILAKIRAITPQ
jgi:hypothetical protein